MSVHVTAPVWKSSQATGNTLLFLLAIADWAQDSGFAWGKMETFCEKANIKSLTTGYAAKRRLVESGELIAYNRQDGCSAYFVRVEGVDMPDEFEQLQILKELDRSAEWQLYVPSDEDRDQELVKGDHSQELVMHPTESGHAIAKDWPDHSQELATHIRNTRDLHVTDTTPTLLDGKPSTHTPRPRDEIWDGLVAAFGYSPETKNEQGLWGKLRKVIKETSANPIADLGERILIWEYHYDTPLTPATLLNKWQWLGSPMAAPEANRREQVRALLEERASEDTFWQAVQDDRQRRLENKR